jgi:hypothetical protein
MLEASARRIEAELPPHARVLDVGAGAQPFPRADAVLDLLPYEGRGALGWSGDPAGERFSAATWVTRDVCDRAPWPFDSGAFDFAVCSHTLEDVRDPVWVCAELARVARAGYIEVPALVEELTWGIQGGPWAGWGHHHWLCEVGEGSIDFVFKHHVVHRPGMHLPAGFLAAVAPNARVQSLWWTGGFSARERILSGASELDGWLAGLVAAEQARWPAPPTRRRWGTVRAGNPPWPRRKRR